MKKLPPPTGVSRLRIEYLAITALIPNLRNARIHGPAQLKRLEAIILENGWIIPIVVDELNNVLAGHARLLVARLLGMTEVPCVHVAHLTAAQKRAFTIADNRIAELAEWDPDLLREEFAALCEIEFPVELTAFNTAEIDLMLDVSPSTSGNGADADDVLPPNDRDIPAVTRLGDCWEAGVHRIVCGNAHDDGAYATVLGDRQANMIITDPPYNVPIGGHVSGLGKANHPEFLMASGELSSEAFTAFLRDAMHRMARFSTDGSIHFIFMDWRGLMEMSAAGAEAYTELKALCVWKKSNGGMGSLYRSQHELVFVFKKGAAPHQNNVQLGKFGRYRTNVWEYAGANTFGPTRDADLAAHPSVKPTVMISDAIRDCSKRNDVVLDSFAGSGVILLAAERTGRRAAAIELDPYYVDTAVRRWQQRIGTPATLLGTGETFDEVAVIRASEPPEPSPPAPTSAKAKRHD